MTDQLQRTEAWESARCGRITASRMKDVIALGKRDGKPLQARENYLGELVVEILTGEPQGISMTPAMQWGVDVEPAARAAYEAHHGVIAVETGFLAAAEPDCVGCSPDGLVGDEGGLEIKCPFNPIRHLRTIIEGMPDEHMPQIQASMWVTGREWWDFVSFDPRMPKHLRLYQQRIVRDEDYIDMLAGHCASLWADVQRFVEQLQQRQAA